MTERGSCETLALTCSRIWYIYSTWDPTGKVILRMSSRGAFSNFSSSGFEAAPMPARSRRWMLSMSDSNFLSYSARGFPWIFGGGLDHQIDSGVKFAARGRNVVAQVKPASGFVALLERDPWWRRSAVRLGMAGVGVRSCGGTSFRYVDWGAAEQRGCRLTVLRKAVFAGWGDGSSFGREIAGVNRNWWLRL